LPSTNSEETSERATCQKHPTLVWQTPRNEETRTNLTVRKAEEVTRDERVATGVAQKTEVKSLVLMQVNFRSILNKSLDFWNLIDAYNPGVMLGTESCLRQEVSNDKVYRDDYTVFRRNCDTRGSRVFIFVKNTLHA
jgi:hypothetical protein